ncbi:hypothetical protein [Kocuria sp. CPCC 204721]|uniref:hypothetical protein n=1 Tax=Kocuria sp. CPCC 204721 TaxID=3073548 RepID=UPI0034D5244A
MSDMTIRDDRPAVLRYGDYQFVMTAEAAQDIVDRLRFYLERPSDRLMPDIEFEDHQGNYHRIVPQSGLLVAVSVKKGH